MADDYVERVVLRVNGVDLDDVIVSCKERSTRPTTPVHTMNKARVARGFKQGNNMYSLELDAEPIDDPRVPDWHTLKDKGIRIAITVTPNIGKARSYGGVAITDIGDTTNDGGGSRTISCMARTRR